GEVVRRIPLPCPKPSVVAQDDLAIFGQEVEERWRRRAKEPLLRHFERQLKDGRAKVSQYDMGVVRIDDGPLGRLLKEVAGMVHQVLVERRVVADEDGQRILLAPAGPARLLPRARDGARITHQEGSV